MSKLAVSVTLTLSLVVCGPVFAQPEQSGDAPIDNSTSGTARGGRNRGAFREGGRMTRAERQALRAELVEKKAAGTLSAEETATLERMERLQERHEKLREAGEARRATRKDRAERHRQQLANDISVAKREKVRKAFKTHAWRMARLTRAREVAEAEERTDLTTHIDELVAKEQARHEAVVAELKTGAAQ